MDDNQTFQAWWDQWVVVLDRVRTEPPKSSSELVTRRLGAVPPGFHPLDLLHYVISANEEFTSWEIHARPFIISLSIRLWP